MLLPRPGDSLVVGHAAVDHRLLVRVDHDEGQLDGRARLRRAVHLLQLPTTASQQRHSDVTVQTVWRHSHRDVKVERHNVTVTSQCSVTSLHVVVTLRNANAGPSRMVIGNAAARQSVAAVTSLNDVTKLSDRSASIGELQ